MELAELNQLLALKQRVEPTALSGERLLAVPDTLSDVFPAGGLRPGWSVGFEGDSGWSLALSLLGSALAPEGWLATVGLEELGLVAAAERGVRLDRVIVVETPPANQWATVVAALVDSVDVIAVAPTASVHPRAARRIAARAREQGTVLFHLDGGRAWPEALDVSLTAATKSWVGIGQGHGHIKGRQVSVSATGRRQMVQARHVTLWLPAPERLDPAREDSVDREVRSDVSWSADDGRLVS